LPPFYSLDRMGGLRVLAAWGCWPYYSTILPIE
jgi:hypothetical protein